MCLEKGESLFSLGIGENSFQASPFSFPFVLDKPVVLNYKGEKGGSGFPGFSGMDGTKGAGSSSGIDGTVGQQGRGGDGPVVKFLIVPYIIEYSDKEKSSVGFIVYDLKKKHSVLSAKMKMTIDASGGQGGKGGPGGSGGAAGSYGTTSGKAGSKGSGGYGGDDGGQVTIYYIDDTILEYLYVDVSGGKPGDFVDEDLFSFRYSSEWELMHTGADGNVIYKKVTFEKSPELLKRCTTDGFHIENVVKYLQ